LLYTTGAAVHNLWFPLFGNKCASFVRIVDNVT